MSRTQRQARILELLESHEVKSQGDLSDLLVAEGIEVTQATLSRDLVEVGAVKVRRGGVLVYSVPGGGDVAASGSLGDSASARLRRAVDEILVSATAAQHTVVLRTPPGAANYLASAIDQTRDPAVIGTLAGDDTILIITADSRSAKQVAERLLGLVGTRD